MDKISRFVSDLGLAAYLVMHGYQVTGKSGRAIYFEVHDQQESQEFDRLVLEYQPPNLFYTFDSCLMFLKKITDISPVGNLVDLEVVSDLGAAAYLLLNEYNEIDSLGCKVVGRKGKNVYFSVPADERERFRRKTFEYFTSQYATYDANLMGLKKIGEYEPAK